MTGMNDFLVSDLIPCVNLKYLDVGVYTSVAAETTFHALAALPEHSIQLHEFVARDRTSTTVMKFFSARRPDGQPIINFGSLSKITVALDNPNETLQELFKCCHALTNAHISFRDPRNVRPSLSDMLRPSMQTLRHIVVNIHVVNDGDDSVLGIPSEFEDMRTKNIIETVTIRILVRMHASYRLIGDDWGRLDEILTSPGWFSLKRVSLAVEIPRYNTGESELEVALRKLPGTRFPRLSSSNSVSLDINLKVYP